MRRLDRAQFLRCYATYLAGSKQQQEERVEKAGALGQAEAVNPDLEALENELREGRNQVCRAFAPLDERPYFLLHIFILADRSLSHLPSLYLFSTG